MLVLVYPEDLKRQVKYSLMTKISFHTNLKLNKILPTKTAVCIFLLLTKMCIFSWSYKLKSNVGYRHTIFTYLDFFISLQNFWSNIFWINEAVTFSCDWCLMPRCEAVECWAPIIRLNCYIRPDAYYIWFQRHLRQRKYLKINWELLCKCLMFYFIKFCDKNKVKVAFFLQGPCLCLIRKEFAFCSRRKLREKNKCLTISFYMLYL